MSLEKLERAIERAKEISPRRNFVQAIDLIVNLRDFDVRKPENRINEVVELPHQVGEGNKICTIASGSLATRARDAGADKVLTEEDLEKFKVDKKAAKKLAREFDFFIAEGPLMPTIGRILGPILGPRGKMPSPVRFDVDIASLLAKYRKSVRIRIKDQPVIQCRIGREDEPSREIAENAQTVINRLCEILERGSRNIASIYVKTTMGPPVLVE